MKPPCWKVGEVSRMTGLTIRTLHHYDRERLLSPSRQTDSGHRLYTREDLARLQQIMSLRQLGFSLEEVRECLASPRFSPGEVVRLHLARVRERIELEQRLYQRLEALAEQLRDKKEVSPEELFQTIEVINMTEKYPFTPEQMETIKRQGEMLGSEKIREVEQEWPRLIARVKEEMGKGTPPDSPEVQALAARWSELVSMFTGGDPGIENTLKQRYQESPNYAAQYGMDQKLFEYAGRAIEALKKK
ncbi:MAG: MerR family transcriptional regulator [Firmicutes bacterium]|nr:MerR family transcriptional regulator [Bacillota bacterium]